MILTKFFLDENGLPIISKEKGVDLAQFVHSSVVDYFLRNTIGRESLNNECKRWSLVEDAETRADEPYGGSVQFSFDWRLFGDIDSNEAYKYVGQQLMNAQIFWIEPMMAEIIDRGAAFLYQHGMATGQWPVILPEEFAPFNTNMFICSISSDSELDKESGEFIRKNEDESVLNCRWLTRGLHKKTRLSLEEGKHLYGIPEDTPLPDVVGETIGMWDTKVDTCLLDINFYGSTEPTDMWAWDLNQDMYVLEEDQLLELSTRKHLENGKYLLPTWCKWPANARVLCGVRAFLDYINRKGMNDLSESEIPKSTVKKLKRKADKSGFDLGSWKDTVKIIDLPRKPYKPSENNESGRRLTCQFVVEQHIRQQHYPTLGPAYLDEEKTVRNPESHRAILIPSHIKGPEDAPFKEYDKTVYAVLSAKE